MLPTRTHLLENKHRREDLQGRITIYYRLAHSKWQQDGLALSFPNGMPGEAIETQLQAGEFQSWGGPGTPGVFLTLCLFPLLHPALRPVPTELIGQEVR